MDVKTFAAELSRALAKRGIPRETAVKHAVSLVRTFDEEDLREITLYKTAEDFDDLSEAMIEKYAALLRTPQALFRTPMGVMAIPMDAESAE